MIDNWNTGMIGTTIRANLEALWIESQNNNGLNNDGSIAFCGVNLYLEDKGDGLALYAIGTDALLCYDTEIVEVYDVVEDGRYVVMRGQGDGFTVSDEEATVMSE